MKRILFVFILIICTFYTNAQKNVFILVDVSKSVKFNQLDDAKTALREILLTGNCSNGTILGSDPSYLQFYKLQTNDRVAINSFGDLQTSANIIPILKTVNDLSKDIDHVLNSITWTPRDNWTYLTLARAKIAEFANKRSINNYVLIEITDNINDDYGPNGNSNYEGNVYLEGLITGYNTTNNRVTDNGWTKISFGTDKKFLLSLTSGINISTYTPPLFQPINNGITITFPSQTKNGAELEINDDVFNLTWECVNCKPNLVYSVSIEGYGGNTYSQYIDTIKNKYTRLKLPQNGMYQIVVSSNDMNFGSDTAFIKMNAIKDTKIKISSPIGTKKTPKIINEGESVLLSWRCLDCDENTTYTISISGIEGTKMKNRPRPIKTKNYTTSINDLSPGNYRIIVSGTDEAKSDTTYIKIKKKGGAGILIFLLFIGVGTYFLLKKMKKRTSEQSSSDINYSKKQVRLENNKKNTDNLSEDDEMF